MIAERKKINDAENNTNTQARPNGYTAIWPTRETRGYNSKKKKKVKQEQKQKQAMTNNTTYRVSTKPPKYNNVPQILIIKQTRCTNFSNLFLE